MDLCYLKLNGTGHCLFSSKFCPFRQRCTSLERPFLGSSQKIGSSGGEDCGVSESRAFKLKSSRRRSMVVRAMGKKNHDSSPSSGSSDQPVPEGDIPEGSNPVSDSTKSDEVSSHKSHDVISDWRTFRANLVVREQVELLEADDPSYHPLSQDSSKSLGLKWAHPIHAPETGCVLVATEKLDGVRPFERTVVLLLRSGSKNHREGPFGVIISRPLHKKIKHMKPSNADLATTFSDCPLYFGGPLEASMFLLKTGDQSLHLPAFEQVMPGLSFGARNSLHEAANLVKKGALRAQDFRFFVGYAGWQYDQLAEEIESDYWYVAACSENVITGASSDHGSGLWEEILQLMGGQYSELSRKPKPGGS